jgi:hypothetical protein
MAFILKELFLSICYIFTKLDFCHFSNLEERKGGN